MKRSCTRVLTIAVAMLLLHAPSVSAQWYRPWHKQKAAPVAAPPVSAVVSNVPTTTIVPIDTTPVAGVSTTTTHANQAGVGAKTESPGVTTPQPGSPTDALSPEMRAKKQQLRRSAAELERRAALTDPDSTAAIRRLAVVRIEAWQNIVTLDPNDAEAPVALERAHRDLDAAKQQELTRARDSSVAMVAQRQHVATAQQALRSGDLMTADKEAAAVLAGDSSNAEALAVQQAVHARRTEHAARKRMLVSSGAAVAIAAVLAFLLYKLVPRIREARARAGEKKLQAVLQVVDGVGRGRMVPVEREIFRIGSSGSDQPTDQNDLVLSDSAATISRNHCSILRRGRSYRIFDSSMNGTMLNGHALARGEERALRHGDEVTIANASRIRFLLV